MKSFEQYLEEVLEPKRKSGLSDKQVKEILAKLNQMPKSKGEIELNKLISDVKSIITRS